MKRVSSVIYKQTFNPGIYDKLIDIYACRIGTSLSLSSFDYVRNSANIYTQHSETLTMHANRARSTWSSCNSLEGYLFRYLEWNEENRSSENNCCILSTFLE